MSRSQKQQTVKIAKIIGIAAVGVLIIYLVTRLTSNNPSEVAADDNQNTISGPIATQEINKTFTVPILDDAGKEIASLEYGVESVELRDEILVKGQKASAVPGRQFLLLNLKINNNSESGMSVKTRNYLRLSVNGNQEEWLAPDIHNDPVEVQAISTKKTRVGFPINETDTNLVLRFGEISGEKELIELGIK